MACNDGGADVATPAHSRIRAACTLKCRSSISPHRSAPATADQPRQNGRRTAALAKPTFSPDLHFMCREAPETIRQTLACHGNAPETAQFSVAHHSPHGFYEECKRNGWLVTEDGQVSAAMGRWWKPVLKAVNCVQNMKTHCKWRELQLPPEARQRFGNHCAARLNRPPWRLLSDATFTRLR